MNNLIEHIIDEELLWLSADRTIFWENQNALIVSDLHFGKTGHFRKSGIAVPAAIYKEDLQRLFNSIFYFKAKRLIVVGDMFHSVANKELNLFLKWRNDIENVTINLIKGNHDILKPQWYVDANICVHEQYLLMNHFAFVHDMDTPISHTLTKVPYVFSGHIHPGIVIKGMSRQRLQFPCFWFGLHYAILPAFSRFTGTMPLKRISTDTIFAIVNQQIVKV